MVTDYLDRYGNVFNIGTKVAFNCSGNVAIGIIRTLKYEYSMWHDIRYDVLKAEVEHIYDESATGFRYEGGFEKGRISKISNLFNTGVVIE